jgi:DNA end-binding protein Ku
LSVPRAIWTGAISFGLVNVPVKLYTATENKDVSFHQFDKGSGERIRNKRVAEKSGKEVDYDDIVKGYEVSKGEYVIVTPDELEAVEPTRSRTIEIEDFVDRDEIDPIFFQKSYYVAPADESAKKPYALLLAAMQEADKVAVARFVMRGKQYIAAVRPAERILVLETMFFADEVRDPGEIEEVERFAGKVKVSARERAAAAQLVESLAAKWEPERYEDTYREEVLDLIRRKAKGEDIVVDRPTAEPKVADLMEALEASIREARQGKKGGGRDDGRRFDAMSKDQLYEEAQRRDIPGRSKMGRDELAEALRAAS